MASFSPGPRWKRRTGARKCAGPRSRLAHPPKPKPNSGSSWSHARTTICANSAAPLFTDYLNKTYLPLLATSGKKPDTIVSEKAHYKRWDKALGHLRLDKIRPSHVLGVLHKLRLVRAARTCKVALVCLRHVLKAAKRDRHIKVLPVEDIPWQKTETKSRRLYIGAQFIKSILYR